MTIFVFPKVYKVTPFRIFRSLSNGEERLPQVCTWYNSGGRGCGAGSLVIPALGKLRQEEYKLQVLSLRRNREKKRQTIKKKKSQVLCTELP